MKKWLSLFLFAIMLVACSSPAVSTSIPPTLTVTLIPPTETQIPTATSTPTETPDPNMPADATGKDAQGNYIKVENGVTYTWMQFPLGNAGEIYKGWFESRMKNGPIDLTGYGDGISGDIPLNFTVYFADNFEFAADGKYLIHPDGTSDYITKGKTPWSLASLVVQDLWIRSTGLDIDTIQKTYTVNQINNDIAKFVSNLNNGGSVDVNGSQWEVRKGFAEIWINAADAKNDPDMILANDLYMKIMVVNKQLIVIMAPAKEDAMIDSKFRREMLAPLQAVLTGSDPLPKDTSWMDYELFGALTDKTGTIGGVLITTETISFVP